METNGNGKIEAMRRRLAAYKTKLDQAAVLDQKAKAKLQAREFAEVGEALCKYAQQSPEFKTMLRQVVPVAAAAVCDDAARKFLTGRGWL